MPIIPVWNSSHDIIFTVHILLPPHSDTTFLLLFTKFWNKNFFSYFSLHSDLTFYTHFRLAICVAKINFFDPFRADKTILSGAAKSQGLVTSDPSQQFPPNITIEMNNTQKRVWDKKKKKSAIFSRLSCFTFCQFVVSLFYFFKISIVKMIFWKY